MTDDSGVYGIFDKDDSCWYVGQSIHLTQRFDEHKKYEHDGWHDEMQSRINDFTFKVLVYENDYTKLRDLEDDYIDLYNPKYTSKESNKGSVVGHLSDETKKKMRAAKTGVPRPDIVGDNNPNKRQDVRDKKREKMSGRIHINNGLEERCVTQDEYNTLDKSVWTPCGKSRKKASTINTKWMYNPNSNENPILVKKCDVEQKKKEGYILGRKKRA